MGTLVKTFHIRGTSLKQAWDDYLEEDIRENGEGAYKGTIYGVSFPELVDKFPDDVDKYDSKAICIKKPKENTNKIKTSVESFPCKAARKWETYYYGVTSWEYTHVESITDVSQTECIKKARAYVEKYPNKRIIILIGKRLVNSPNKVAEISGKSNSNTSEGVWECIAGCSY